MGAPKEVFLVCLTLHLRSVTQNQLPRCLEKAYVSGALRLVDHLDTLLALAEDMGTREVLYMMNIVK